MDDTATAGEGGEGSSRCMSLPLEDYAVVGDMRTLGAVGANGSLDWLCWPRFDSPSLFGRLLDQDGGSWRLGPSDEPDATRQVYLSGTNVLVTRFHTSGGVVEVEDLMTLGDAGQHVVRAVRCLVGSVEMTTLLDVRPDYGRTHGDVSVNDDGATIRYSIDGVTTELQVSGTCSWTADERRLRCTFELAEGDVEYLVLGDRTLDRSDCVEQHTSTTRFWRDWSETTAYSGRWREHVERSALVLKLLTHEPTGGIIAAGTTSLPEVIGGERNWDYRYVWIRDAAFTVYAFIELGHLAEAEAFAGWLVDRLDRCDDSDVPPLSPLYDLDGNDDIDEIELDHWSGYAQSSPVRVGNAASGQLQLDIYGELIDALYLADKHGQGLGLETWRHISTIIDWLSRHWQEPDDGMWEARSGPQRHTSSLLMSWVAVERAIRMAQKRGRPAPLERWRRLRDDMHATLVDRGYNDEVGAFTQTLDGDTVDASMLLAPLVKFISPTDPMWISTLDVIGDRLVHGPLVDRYDNESTEDGLDGDEGAFTICSFWYVEALARSRRLDEARDLFDRLLSYASPTGIFSEEIGPSGRLIGNLPQAFTHLALISAAIYLDEALADTSNSAT
ncbi:MAG: glycoside hydrolase family 15 protein [Ilumatobacter sp.]|uniref:glycoside hydrolase family 15 protein n=1 Tax=Ilumatobacter sp. TaxID=1967498 RepID=UPI003C76F382